MRVHEMFVVSRLKRHFKIRGTLIMKIEDHEIGRFLESDGWGPRRRSRLLGHHRMQNLPWRLG